MRVSPFVSLVRERFNLTAHILFYLQGLLDTKTPLLVLLVSNSVNFCLDILLIFGSDKLHIPAYGAPGAAAATVVAGTINCKQSMLHAIFRFILAILPT